MKVSEVKKAIKANPDAKAMILVNNPTYYGICSDLGSIVKLAHQPWNALPCRMRHTAPNPLLWRKSSDLRNGAGADMAAVSMHKSGGSLTLSSVLLTWSCHE